MELKEKVRELSQLNDLKREMTDLKQHLEALETAALGGVSRWNGMPGRCGNGDRVSEYAIKLMEVRGRMERRRADCADELLKLCAFIDSVEDSRMRRILTARYIDGLSWQQIAWKIDEYDEQIPRKLHNKFLLKQIS